MPGRRSIGAFSLDDMWTRVGEQLMARVSGPMHFRLVLQPVMGKPPYFWSLLYDPAHRKEMVRDGWKSVGRVFILALILDAIYQGIVLHFFYLGEAIIVAIVLAIVPYLILRGIVTRLARKRLAPPDVPVKVPPESPRR